MDEVSRGLDEMALSAPDNTLPHGQRDGYIAVEACGCAEVARNDSVGDLSTPLHRCKGRHHLPIIGEEMQGDQLPKVPADKPQDKDKNSPEPTSQEPAAADPCGSHNLDPGQSQECTARSCDAVLQAPDFLPAGSENQACPQGTRSAEESSMAAAEQSSANRGNGNSVVAAQAAESEKREQQPQPQQEEHQRGVAHQVSQESDSVCSDISVHPTVI